jgi:hypothetical protein
MVYNAISLRVNKQIIKYEEKGRGTRGGVRKKPHDIACFYLLSFNFQLII